MKRSTKLRKAAGRPKRPRASLLAPAAMGGINAGKGFDFQARFAACKVPVWLLEAAFHQLFYEGTGDIDIRYQENGKSTRIHIQVKDHEVTLHEFKQSIEHFRQLDADLPGVYTCFTLVCPALSARLRPAEAGLARYRKAVPFYDDAALGIAPTKNDIDARLRRLKLSDRDIAFIHQSVTLEIGHADLQHDERAIETFVARLLKHPDYADKVLAAVQPVFAHLLRVLQDKRGQVLGRAEIDQILRAAVSAAGPAEKSITLWMHNWTKETFDIPADYAIDWSQHFDRTARRVPDADTWNNRLLPELKILRERVQGERAERVIRFRGKCPLSSGIALGAAFPAVGGWVFEIPQPPAKESWRSDATPKKPHDLQVDVVTDVGTDLVLGLNIRGDGREDVRRYIDSTSDPPKLFAFMAPATTGSQSLSGSEEACAFAQSVRERLGQLLKAHDIRHTRLFFYGPFALAIFLGQQLTSMGSVQLCEYQDP